MRWLIASCVLLGLAGAPDARAHRDVLFYDVDGGIATGATDFGPPFQLVPDVRVFPVEMNTGKVTTAPGFTADASPPLGVGIAPFSDVFVDFVAVPALEGRNLSWWDGVEPVAWSAPPAGESLRLRESSCFSCDQIFADGDTADVTGFSIGEVASAGLLHRHHEFRVFGDGAFPEDGVYLVALRARVEGLAPSEPFYFVFSADAGAAPLEPATAWVESVLLPEPSSAGVAALAALAALVRRRSPPRRRCASAR